VFTRSDSTWTQQGQELTGGGESASGLLGSVALSADGNTALIGGGGDNGSVGAAWVFVNPPRCRNQSRQRDTMDFEVSSRGAVAMFYSSSVLTRSRIARSRAVGAERAGAQQEACAPARCAALSPLSDEG
jgi:hypothetical protein